MKKIVLLMAVVMSVSMVGCERMKGYYDKAKFWEKEDRSNAYEVTVTNISKGSYLTPILAVGHGDDQGGMFEFGSAASAELQAVAEGGNIEPIAETFNAKSSQIVRNPNGGLLGPGQSTTFKISNEYGRMSLIAMILPTNDGFVAANNIQLKAGKQELYPIDAGTEANDERITGGGAPNTPGIPAEPGGNFNAEATGIASASVEGKIDRHPGIIGGEGSALDPAVHGWDNQPVAVIRIGN